MMVRIFYHFIFFFIQFPIRSLSLATSLDCTQCLCSEFELNCNGRVPNLIGIHYTFANTTKLRLQSNKIDDLTSLSFEYSSHLKVLDLSVNNVALLPLGIFDNLLELRYLNLSYNILVYVEIRADAFASLGNLQILDISNQFQSQSDMPLNVFKGLPLLEELHMTGVPSVADSFTYLRKVKVVNFGDQWCHMPNISEPFFYPMFGLHQVEVISFRACAVQYMTRRFFSYFRSLKRLDLSYNAGLSSFIEEAVQWEKSVMDSLEVLLIDNVTYFSDETSNPLRLSAAITNFPNLKALSLNFNDLRNDNFSGFDVVTPDLRYLSMEVSQTNLIQALPGACVWFPSINLLRNLRIYDMSGRRIESSAYLMKQDLQYKRPHSLITEAEYPWTKFGTSLPCDHLCLKDLPYEGEYESKCTAYLLKYLKRSPIKVFRSKYQIIGRRLDNGLLCGNISSCSFYLKQTFLLFPKYAEEVDFSYIDTFEGRCDFRLPYRRSLKKLILQSSLCVIVNTDLLKAFPSLSYLDLSNNRLNNFLSNDIEGKFFNNSQALQVVILHSNEITYLPSGIFLSLLNLEKLDLSNNLLQHFKVSLGSTTHLKYLGLSHNHLKYLDQSLLVRNGPHCLQIEMGNNSFICNCESDFMKFCQWVFSRKAYFPSYQQYWCSQEHKTVYQWYKTDYKLQCDVISSATIDITTKVIASIGAVLFLLVCIIIVYKWRYSLFYKGIIWKRNCCLRFKPTDCVPMINIEERIFQLKLYMAVEECFDLMELLINDNFLIASRNNPSRLKGYRWSQVVQDIDESDLVIILLSDRSMDDPDAYMDLMFAIEKGVARTLLVVQGVLSSILDSESTKRILKNFHLISWTGDFNEEFIVCLREKARELNVMFNV